MTRVDPRALIVWDALIRLYGDRFSTVYGDEPQPVWVEQIRMLSDFELNHGIAHLAATGKVQFPCNLSEFTEACRTAPSRGESGGSGRSSSYGRYKPPAPVEVADHYLAKCRELFAPKPK